MLNEALSLNMEGGSMFEVGAELTHNRFEEFDKKECSPQPKKAETYFVRACHYGSNIPYLVLHDIVYSLSFCDRQITRLILRIRLCPSQPIRHTPRPRH